jgi:DmsE family decaheme c-type cytochrome
MTRRFLQALLLICVGTGSGALLAEDGPGCLDCHTADADDPVHTVFRSIHGNIGNEGAAVCTSCHGPSEAHDRRGRREAPDVSWGPTWLSDVDTRNGACQACHENGAQLLWTGSGHQQENLACTDCHSAHVLRDPTLETRVAQEQCTDCHTQVRAQINLPSRHPIAEGKTACVDCHNPHGSMSDASLHQVSLNDNCLSCHQDLRGPHLWEHEPATEDCSLCHRPHGSVHERLLVTRGPALCQQCHSAAFHPSVPAGGESLASGGARQNILGKDCLNCHSQVHGSNHPSGARLTR